MKENGEPEILISKIDTLERYIAVTNRIRTYQEPEESACAALGVDAQIYRKVMDLLPGKTEQIPYTAWAKWEDRLLSDICMEPCQAPSDFLSVFDDICEKEGCYRSGRILMEHYQDNMTCLEISEQDDVSASGVRKQLDQMLRLLRKPEYRAALQYGADYANLQEYLESRQTAYENDVVNLLEEKDTFRKNSLLAMEDKLSRREKEEEVRRIGKEASDRNDQLRKINLDDFGFSVRTGNALKRSGIRNAYQIFALTPEELLKIRNLGPVSRKEIRKKMMEKCGIKMEKI